MVDLFDSLSIYLLPLGVVLLVIIFTIIGIALAKTAFTFVERFPREEAAEGDYYSYKALAERYKAEAKSYLKSIDRLRQEHINAIKALKDHIGEADIKDNLVAELEALERKLDYESGVLEDTLKEKTKYEIEKDLLENVLSDLGSQRENAQKELEQLKESLKNMSEQKAEKAKLTSEIDALANKIDKLNGDYKLTESTYNRLKDAAKALLADEKKNEERRQTINSLESKISGNQRKLNDINNQLAVSEVKISELQSIKNSLEGEIKKLKGEHIDTQKGIKEGYKNLMNPPEALKTYAAKRLDAFEDEVTELKKFNAFLESNKYFFSERTIKAFHTALKIQYANPLTVLAGISGTGKTLLPTKYAEYFGIYSVVLPVEPRWDSPQDLLGFYNYLEKKYQATELSRTLVAFDNRNDYQTPPHKKTDENLAVSEILNNRMVIILLDEMNLARTEYYFSNFLSRLELRRTVTDDTDKSNRKNAEITIDDSFGNIWVPANVLFVGTMNEDESTQTLSDKVLDRSNLLRFGKPSDEKLSSTASAGTANAEISSHSAMPYSIFEAWIIKSEDVNHRLGDYQEFVENTINALNAALSLVGKPFGFRVLEAMRSYVANYPVEDETDINYALADQVEQKIMPKLRGLDLSVQNSIDCLDKVGEVIDSLHDDALISAFAEAKEDRFSTGMFMWQGVTR